MNQEAGGSDDIEITLLPDGRMKIDTDEVSLANHTSAEAMVRFISDASGGSVEVSRKQKKHKHAHHEKTKAKT